MERGAWGTGDRIIKVGNLHYNTDARGRKNTLLSATSPVREDDAYRSSELWNFIQRCSGPHFGTLQVFWIWKVWSHVVFPTARSQRRGDAPFLR